MPRNSFRPTGGCVLMGVGMHVHICVCLWEDGGRRHGATSAVCSNFSSLSDALCMPQPALCGHFACRLWRTESTSWCSCASLLHQTNLPQTVWSSHQQPFPTGTASISRLLLQPPTGAVLSSHQLLRPCLHPLTDKVVRSLQCTQLCLHQHLHYHQPEPLSMSA